MQRWHDRWGCQRENFGTFGPEVLRPSLSPRIEQHDGLPGLWINGSQVWSFPTVAMETGERKIFQRSLTAMLFRDDMVGFMRKKHARLPHATIFTMPAGTLMHCLPQRGRNPLPAHEVVCRCRVASALI